MAASPNAPLSWASKAFQLSCCVASDARAETAGDRPPPPPWHLPRFDGAEDPRDKSPGGALEPPPALDARGLYDLVITCFPACSWWRPEIALEARYM